MKDREYDQPDHRDSLGEEDFLKRWSRRKSTAHDPILPIQQGSTASTTRSAAQEEDNREPIASQPTDADMPPLESLNEDADYSRFLSPRVSEELRKLALRKLFHLPQFNISDGLNDYDEDYTTYAALGTIVTHEMIRLRELEKERAAVARKPNELSEGIDSKTMVDKVVAREDSVANTAIKKAPESTGAEANNVDRQNTKWSSKEHPDSEKLSG